MREWKIRFGTAGTSDSFAAQGYKTSLDIPAYTARMGLNAFEYQCGRGVRLGLDKARQMAADAAARDILFSVHAPYYISMSSLEEDKRLNSVNYLLQSAAVCKALGGQRVIFHSGSCGRQSREAALEKALDTLKRAQDALDEAGFAEITLCPETMGKIGQLGTLDEVLALCRVDRRITPCIDFGHLNARTLGGIASKADYAAILDRMEEALGDARARRFQVHFSRIEYTAGGECMIADILALENEKIDSGKEYRFYHPMVDYRQFSCTAAKVEPLLKLKLKDGKRTEKRISDGEQLRLARENMQKQLASLDESYKRLLNPHIYKVSLTEELKELKADFIRKNIE